MRTLSTERYGSEQRALPDNVVEQVKHAVLFGGGYKHPPQHTRFKKGQSGNPKGRPKSNDIRMSSRSADGLVLKEAERAITVREGGEAKELSQIKVVMRTQYNTAIKGSAYAQKHIIERYERAERERTWEITRDVEFWESYVEFYRAAIAEAERNGDTLPNPLPHPDDVIIDDERGVRFRGPFDEEGQKRL